MGPLSFLSLLGVPLILGAAVLGALGVGPRVDRVAYAGWAWMIGALGTAAVVFAWLWTGLPVGAPTVPVLGVLGLALGVLLLGRWVAVERVPEPGRPATAAWEAWFFRAALAFVLVVTLERVADASLLAVVGTDEGSFWAFRAKLLFHEGGFGPGYGAAAASRGLPNADYPLLNPLLQMWSFAHSGRITHVVNRIPIHAGSVALVLVLAGALRRFARPGVAALLLLLLPAMEPAADAARWAYSDALVALGAVVGLDALLRWRAERHPAWVGLGALAAGFALWSKHEGALIACAFLAAAALDRFLATPRSLRWPRPARLQLWLLVPAGVTALTWAVNRRFDARNFFMEKRSSGLPDGVDLEGNFVTTFFANLPERLAPTLEYFLDRVFLRASHAQYAEAAAVLLILLAPRAIGRSSLRLPAIALILALAGFVLVFVGLPRELEWHLVTAAARITFQLAPATLLLLGALSSLLLVSTRSRARPVVTLLMLFLVWRGAVSVWQTGLELVRRFPETVPAALVRSEDERIVAALEDLEDRRQLAPGRVVSIYRALMEEVPEEGRVVALLSPDDPDRAIAKSWLLTYPRSYHFQRPPRSAAPARPFAQLEGDFWVLDLAGIPDLLARHFTVVREGRDWALWH